MKAQVHKTRLVTDEQGNAELVLSLYKSNLPKIKQDLAKLKQRLEKGKMFDVEIKQHREKRSLDANAYMWVLLDKMAEKLPESKDELYEKMLVEYGVFETVSLKKEAVEAFMKQWAGPVKRLGSGFVKGKEFVHLRICFGSSSYDTKQMSRLLEGIVRECQDLGIETKTPAELLELTSLMETIHDTE